MSRKLPLAILLSGRGSNMAAILEEVKKGLIAADLKIVISDKPQALGLDLARQNNIETLAVERKYFSDQYSFENKIAEILFEKGIELVVLAGFMRLLSASFIRKFPEKIINVHPSLLPAFPGLNAQKQALDYGVKIAGCTVHYVNEIMDGGRIISQAAVEVLDDDTEESLSARILAQEHRLLPAAVRILAEEYVGRAQPQTLPEGSTL